MDGPLLMDELREERDELAALRELTDVCEEVTWNGYAWIGVSPCVACAHEQPGHAPDCSLDAALSRAWAVLRNG